MHSCLVDALESGTGRAAREKFGLQQISRRRQNRHGLRFYRRAFCRYDNSITCAVWAGFDKPQKIYRGAFGSEIALPIWVDLMNAANERYPAKVIPEPKGMQKAEICTRSGLLATDKCYDTVKSSTGESVHKRTTYVELATAAQMPTEPCNVHGEARARLVRDLAGLRISARFAGRRSKASPADLARRGRSSSPRTILTMRFVPR